MYRTQRICKSCGKVFVIHNPRSRYCSACHYRACVICGAVFRLTSNFSQETCSLSCSKKYDMQKRRVQRICKHCRKPFQGRPQRKYCSMQCSQDAQKKIGKDSRVNWMYRRWRKLVFERDNFTCVRCGANKNITAHHIKPWNDYPELRYEVSNGETLCNYCHKNIHGALVPRKPEFIPVCSSCGKATSGRSKFCLSCSLKQSEKVKGRKRLRDQNGRYIKSK